LGTLRDAQRVVRDAERALRGLIEQGMAEHRYADVAEVARVADALARLLGARQEVSRSPAPPTPTPSRQRRVPKRDGSKKSYPRFVRDRDKLVKVGWSKKSKAEYEQRTPFDVADALVSAIRAQVGDGELFAATDVIPLPASENGASIPDYQAYLALKWLHNEGVVTKHGRDRYAIEQGRLADGMIGELRDRLPTSERKVKP
jgi:hypothetical protein